MQNFPTGTITFLFTDIEGSTTLWEKHPEEMRRALARHDDLLLNAVKDNQGFVVKTTGDGIMAAFHTATDALRAALLAQQALQAEVWPEPISIRVKTGLHTGAADLRDGDYYGPALNRAARLMAAGHGGQVLLSDVTRDLCCDTLPSGVSLLNLGVHRLKDLARPETIYQVAHSDLQNEFPPLRWLANPDLLSNLPHLSPAVSGSFTVHQNTVEIMEATIMLRSMADGPLRPAEILLALRDGGVTTFGSLTRRLGFNQSSRSLLYHSLQIFRSLAEAGFIECATITERPGVLPDDSEPIRLGDNWHKTQAALQLSLNQLASFDPTRTMVVTPQFGIPSNELLRMEPIDVFVAMPFLANLQPVYEDHIKKVAGELGLTVKRGDDFFTSGSIMKDVWIAICKAKIIVADCTGRNPNVFYEIGLAHTIGKSVILITQNADDVPFDVRHLRFIQYAYDPRGVRLMESTLKKTLITELGLTDKASAGQS